jgi:hypothetical protein
VEHRRNALRNAVSSAGTSRVRFQGLSIMRLSAHNRAPLRSKKNLARVDSSINAFYKLEEECVRLCLRRAGALPLHPAKGAGPLWNPWVVSGVAAAGFMRPHNPRPSCNPADGDLGFYGSWLTNSVSRVQLNRIFSVHTFPFGTPNKASILADQVPQQCRSRHRGSFDRSRRSGWCL